MPPDAPILGRPVRRTAVAVLLFGWAVAALWSLSGPGLLTPNLEPVLPDFAIFHTAGRLALGGEAASAYDWRAMTAAFQAFFGMGEMGAVSWNYPPPLLLPVTALAALPYLAAAALWAALGLAALGLGVRALAPGSAFLLAALLFPGTSQALVSGQNGLLLAGALAGALALLERRRDWAAGVLFALVALKPNLAVLLPVALLAGGRWRALAGAAAAGLALALLSLLAFGWAPWQGFLSNLGAIAGWDEAGLLRAYRMPSVYLQLKGLGLGGAAAMAAQGVAALLAASAVAWVWRRDAVSWEMRGAVLTAALPLATPYLFDYDLAVLIVPVLLLWRDGHRRGWLTRGEPVLLLLAWLLAVLPPPVSETLGGHPGAVLAVLLLGLALRRAVRGVTEPAAPAS